MADDAAEQAYGFQAEVKQLMHLMVHALYSNREIFLRELISNASDANDKLRFEALARPELAADSADLAIRVELIPEQKLLCITDDGIGMTRDDIVQQLGTIAHSGTARFIEQMEADSRKDSQLIGQFGVGFYSAFIVADEVEVLSRKAGVPAAEGVRWVSDGQGEFRVQSVEREQRGTTVRLRLKDDAAEFLDPGRLRTVIRKYSDHIAFPVRLREAPDREPETVNQARALWSRPRTEISAEEYKSFYRHISHDFSEPLTWSHNRVEGKRDYTSLLFIPSVAPVDLWNREAPRGIKLYVQKVFITDHATHFLPLYLRFVRGVLDTADLPLNVSREMLQHSPEVAAIRSALTRRVLDMLAKLAADDADRYTTLWREFGTVLKEGLAEDSSNRDRLAELQRFNSTRTGEGEVRSLAQYVDEAPEQDRIYYLIADSVAAAKSSPHLEAFRDSNIEVLLLTDRMDEWAMQYLTEFRGKTFKDVSRGGLDLPGGKDEEQSAKDDTGEKESSGVLDRVKQTLGDRVGEVRASDRLKESASCLVLGDQDLGYGMRDLLKAAGHEAPAAVPDLELNLGHDLVRRMQQEADGTRFGEFALLLYEQAVLAEGRMLDDPAAFVKRINRLLAADVA